VVWCGTPFGRNGLVQIALCMINLLFIITVPINYVMHIIICSFCALSDLPFVMMMWVGQRVG
jgi:hypothetical protein